MRTLRFAALASVVFGLLTGVGEAQVKRGPFTNPPRSVRTRPFDVKHLRLELAFDWDRQQVEGKASHTVVPFAPLAQIELDADGMQIDEALEDGDESTKLTFERRDGKVVVQLGREHPADRELTVSLKYHFREPTRGVHFVVPDKYEPEQRRIVWTQSQPHNARYWFPCFDSPNDRMTSEILATVPAEFFVLSNGVLREERENGDGTKTYHWVQEQTHLPYLMSVVAGEFEAYEQSWDGIPIVSYVPPGRMSDAERSFGNTPAMMEFFSEKIGYRYPWPKYAQICCDEYGGGMEHTSATTLTLGTLHDERAHLDFSSEGLVAHELAHQWWGDLLTCKDWAEIWLNEGFATYFATLWTEHDRGWDAAAWERYNNAQQYMREDSSRYRRPIVTYGYADASNMFDSHTYPKAGQVLHMLRFVLGDELFWKTMNHYAHKHAFGVVETADLRVAIEEATGSGLNWFFDEWLYHGGHPEYEVEYAWEPNEKLVALTVRQKQKVDDLTPLFRMPVEVDLVTAEGTVTKRITVSKAEETFHLRVDARPVRMCFDPRDWILKKLKIEKSKEEWLEQLANDSDCMCRVYAVQSLREHKDDDKVTAALIEAAKEDAYWPVRHQAATALGQFEGEDAVRPALLEIAREDDKSDVRRAALGALGNFKHEETAQVLRDVITEDRSYLAVAAALRALVRVAPESAKDDLLAALEGSSFRDSVFRAAAGGLAQLKEKSARETLLAALQPPSPPRRRMAAISALAQLGNGDDQVGEALIAQLDDPSELVRRGVISALGRTGHPSVIAALENRKSKEGRSALRRAIDQSIKRIRDANGDKPAEEDLRAQLEKLREENRKLKEQLEQRETAAAAASQAASTEAQQEEKAPAESGAKFYQARRAALVEKLDPKGIAIITSGPIRNRSNDVDYEYRPDSNFFYLTGIAEDEATLILLGNQVMGGSREMLFVKEQPDARVARFEGDSLGTERAAEIAGVAPRSVRPAGSFERMLGYAATRAEVVYYPLQRARSLSEKPSGGMELLEQLRTHYPHLAVKNVKPMIEAMRPVKDEHEQALVRKAVAITCDAHREVMKACKVGMYEYQLEAVLEYCFKMRGALEPSFPSIVGAGENALTLHYVENTDRLDDGELIVIDIGAEYEMYAADLTRTIPASGKFTAAQRELYDAVLKAQIEAIAIAKPGSSLGELHNKARDVLNEEGKKLGFTDVPLGRFFVHGVGHHIGLDVHDPGGSGGKFEAGAMIAVEPGVYIPADAQNVPEKYRGIGIRIEDDVLITAEGHELLSAGLARTAEEIEALMAQESGVAIPSSAAQ